MKQELGRKNNILAIDCCNHIFAALGRVKNFKVTGFDSRNNKSIDYPVSDTDLIVIGVSSTPVRRLFLSRLRRFYPEVPMLILRSISIDDETLKEEIRGEFVLSDKEHAGDLETVKSIRRIMPLMFCLHTNPQINYDLVTNVMRVITENYSDPQLNLNQVAQELLTSPSKLSRVLNKHAGVSFRQLLRHIRIEEAKRMLASHKYSVKEVAARVGFTDSHYFSRSFKEMTGSNATKYKYDFHDLLFN